MRRYLALLACLAIIVSYEMKSADETKTQAETYIKGLVDLDPEIKKLFPRWRVCEPELQIQIRRAFVLAGYNKNELDQDKIEVIAIPKRPPEPGIDPEPYKLLHISCGSASMNASEIKKHLRKIEQIIAGGDPFLTNDDNLESKRDYCYQDIPPDNTFSNSQKKAVINWLEPTTVTHSFTLSLFEQTLKVGNSGFWLKNAFGNDQIGYPFWSPGEAKVILKRPLYENSDDNTRSAIPYLIDAYLGVGYANTAGLDDNNNLLSWVPDRQLNIFPGGKLIGGIDFSLPFHPRAGVHLNVEIPLAGVNDKNFVMADYYSYELINRSISWNSPPADAVPDELNVFPILRESGQFTFFYNFWFGNRVPENFIRVDLGLSYAEVREMGHYHLVGQGGAPINYLTKNGVTGLRTYKPNEFGDWFYFKAEYRNTASFPFGFSAQYSNQILLTRVYIPLLSDWLMIEAKYSTPLRGKRPFEVKNFFMVSPVLRITI